MNKMISGFIPIEVHVTDNGVRTLVFPGEFSISSVMVNDNYVKEDEGFDILDSVDWDRPNRWEAI